MVIPNDRAIKRELLVYLASRPGYRAHAQQCYAALEPQFPDLTHAEVTERYQASVSKWANSVQFARLHLVNDGLIYRANAGPTASKGVWILTPAGVNAAQGTAQSDDSASSSAVSGDGVLLGWNRELWDGWPDTYEGTVNRLMAGDRFTDRWSVGRRRDVPPGTDAWLLRQGGPFGLLGHGTVVSNTFVDVHFADEGGTSRYVNVEFDVLLNEEDILSREQLELVIPEVAWRHQFTSGNRVPAPVNVRLKRLWAEHIS